MCCVYTHYWGQVTVQAVYCLLYYTVYRGQLRALLEFAYRGLQDDDLAVRNASLFAIGQFSEHLQVGWGEKGGRKGGREGGREEGRKGEGVGGREGEREGGREEGGGRGREGEREGGREKGGREGGGGGRGREGGREGAVGVMLCLVNCIRLEQAVLE